MTVQQIVSQRKMSIVEHLFHIFMCFATMGLWGIVYASRLRSRKTVMHIPVMQQPAVAFPPPPCVKCGAPFAAHVGGYCPPGWAARPVRY